MKKTKVNHIIEQERPFTTFVSAKYLLDRFSRVEKNYLISKYGIQDLTEIVKHLVISKAIYFNNYPEGETTCKILGCTTTNQSNNSFSFFFFCCQTLPSLEKRSKLARTSMGK